MLEFRISSRNQPAAPSTAGMHACVIGPSQFPITLAEIHSKSRRYQFQRESIVFFTVFLPALRRNMIMRKNQFSESRTPSISITFCQPFVRSRSNS